MTDTTINFCKKKTQGIKGKFKGLVKRIRDIIELRAIADSIDNLSKSIRGHSGESEVEAIQSVNKNIDKINSTLKEKTKDENISVMSQEYYYFSHLVGKEIYVEDKNGNIFDDKVKGFGFQKNCTVNSEKETVEQNFNFIVGCDNSPFVINNIHDIKKICIK